MNLTLKDAIRLIRKTKYLNKIVNLEMCVWLLYENDY